MTNTQIVEEVSRLRQSIENLTIRMDEMENCFRSENIWTDYFDPNNQIDIGQETQMYDNNYRIHNANINVGGASYCVAWLDEPAMKYLIEKITKIERVVGLNVNTTLTDMIYEAERLRNQARDIVNEITDLATRVECVNMDRKELLIIRE